MAIQKVTIYNGSTSLGDATLSGNNWSKSIDTSSMANGTLTLRAEVTTDQGVTSSVTRTFIVNNTPPPSGGTENTDFPQAIGTKTLSARQTFTTSYKDMFGAAFDPITNQGDQPVRTPTRTIILNDLPVYTGTVAAGTDFERRWMGYFGNRNGYSGTWQQNDRIIITGVNQATALNLDIPPSCKNIEIVIGTTSASGVIQFSHADSNTGLMSNHAIRILGNNSTEAGSASGIRIRAASRNYPAVLETLGAVGRTGLNQQGNTMILCDPYTSDIMIQDVYGIGARAAGFFAYRAHRVWYNRCTSTETWADAFHAANGCEDILYTDCTSQRSGDDGIAPVRYNGESDASDSKRIAYIRHRVQTTGHGRGAVTICNSDIYWDQLYVEGSAAGGLLWDREASGSTPYKGIYNALAQRVHLKGCNWSEQDHGSLFLNNGTTTESVIGKIESILIEDANPNRNVVRGVGGSGGVLEITIRDAQAVGGPGNSNWFGGNNLSRISFTPGAVRSETAGADTTPPTLVFLTPGRKATVSGTLTGYPKNSSGVQTLGSTDQYRNTMAICFYAGHVTGIHADGVQVSIGNTLLGTVAKSSLDVAGRGFLDNVDTTRFTNGKAIITLSTKSSSGKTTKKLYREININNSVPGSLSGMPTGWNGEALVSTFGTTTVVDRGVLGITTSTSSSGADTSAPSAVTNLRVTRNSASSATLNWTAATDNVGVTEYRIYRGAGNTTPTLVNTVTSTSYNDSSLTNSASYVYQVAAADAAGNEGSRVSVTLAAAGDTTAPTIPTNVTAQRTSDTGGTVTWTASTDAVGVTGYRVVRTSRQSGNVVTNEVTSGTSYTYSNLNSTSVYDVTVAAYDAAGNFSSTAATVLNLYSGLPVTSANTLMFVDANDTGAADSLRITDLTDQKTGKVFAWSTDSERPIARTLANGRKVAEFLNGRALIEQTGIAGQSSITVSMVMAQRFLVTALRSGYISATPSTANDYDKTVGQWAIGGPAATGETALQSITVSGAPQTGGSYTGFSRALDTYSVVQVVLSVDAAAPVVYVDGVQLTTSATNPTNTGTLFLDRILLGARWFDGGPKDGQQFRLGALAIHQGKLSQTDRNAIRTWAVDKFGTPAP